MFEMDNPCPLYPFSPALLGKSMNKYCIIPATMGSVAVVSMLFGADKVEPGSWGRAAYVWAEEDDVQSVSDLLANMGVKLEKVS